MFHAQKWSHLRNFVGVLTLPSVQSGPKFSPSSFSHLGLTRGPTSGCFFFFFFFMSFPKYSNKHVHSRVQFFKRRCTPNTHGLKNNTTYNAPRSISSLRWDFGSQTRASFMTSTKVMNSQEKQPSYKLQSHDMCNPSLSFTVILSHPWSILAPFISPWMANSCEIKWVFNQNKIN
jgi:hypothetical protein